MENKIKDSRPVKKMNSKSWNSAYIKKCVEDFRNSEDYEKYVESMKKLAKL